MPDNFDNPDWYRQAWQLIREEADELISDFRGNVSGGFNAIKEFREYDCSGQWVLYVETALPAFTAALFLLLTPSIDEILENYLNPKNGRGGSRRGRRARRRWRAGNRGQRRLFFQNAIPDMDEEIAKRLPGGRGIRGRRIGPGEWLFWTGIDAADRVLWYWLLTEAWETFATEWQSEIQESGYCREAGDAHAQFETFNDNHSSVDETCWGPDSEITGKAKNIVLGGSGNVSPAGDTLINGFVIYEFEIRQVNNSDDHPIDVSWELVAWSQNEAGERIVIGTDEGDLFVNPNGLGKVTLTVRAHLTKIPYVQFRFRRTRAEIPGGVGPRAHAGRGTITGTFTTPYE